MSDIAINIEHLTKVYKMFNTPTDRLKEALNPFGKRYSNDFYALRDINLKINKGETIGFIGKNGAGKSTILKIITGVLTPTEGNVFVNGRIASLLELGAGFNPEMTGIENIYMNGSIMGYSKEEIDERIKKIIDFADIGSFIDQPVKMYSSGMFARLAFAVNAFVEPDILIVDEALSVGDLKFQVKCMDKMKELMEGGCTVLFVSHDINTIRRLCTRAIWLNGGKLMLDGDVNYVSDRFLEYIDCVEKHDNNEENEEKKDEVHHIHAGNNDIGNILDFKVMDFNGICKDVFQYNEPLKINVKYEVKDDTLQNVVLGIALRTINNKYMCGLNTLLDKVSIPWKKGINNYGIEYPMGLLTLGGRFYFDVALEDKTATIPIQYVQCVKEITVISEYVSEGTFTIPHKWGDVDE
jgi:lipopolysaccharide transport system ATP-binding protein/teichoic acid transport system ATP-binding protein